MIYNAQHQQRIMGFLSLMCFIPDIYGMTLCGKFEEKGESPSLSKTYAKEEDIRLQNASDLDLDVLYRLQRKINNSETKKKACEALIGEKYGEVICPYGTDYIYAYYQKKQNLTAPENGQLIESLCICLDADCNSLLKNVIDNRAKARELLMLENCLEYRIDSLKKAYECFMLKNNYKKESEWCLKEKHAQAARIALTRFIAEINLASVVNCFGKIDSHLELERDQWLEEWHRQDLSLWALPISSIQVRGNTDAETKRVSLITQGIRLVIQMISQFIKNVDDAIEQKNSASLPATSEDFLERLSFEDMMEASFDKN